LGALIQLCFPDKKVKKLTEHILVMFDENNDEAVSFSEFLMVYWILMYGESRENLGLFFKLFDMDRDEKVNVKDMNKPG